MDSAVTFTYTSNRITKASAKSRWKKVGNSIHFISASKLATQNVSDKKKKPSKWNRVAIHFIGMQIVRKQKEVHDYVCSI